jgi:hypothetical protein
MPVAMYPTRDIEVNIPSSTPKPYDWSSWGWLVR